MTYRVQFVPVAGPWMDFKRRGMIKRIGALLVFHFRIIGRMFIRP